MQSNLAQAETLVLMTPQDGGLSDRSLVERAVTGDRWAEEAIYLRYVGYVNNLCLRLLRTENDTQDVVQDTFVDVLEQIRTLREPDRLRQWITTIAVHKAHRRFRRRRLLDLLGLRNGNRDELCSLHAAPDLSPELCSEIAHLDRALSRVSDEDRACWILRYVEGRELSEVAHLCGCSLATAKRRIARADAAVREHVQMDEGNDE
jgi:RNA polymerase sigma-70 factor (ECF subfamily)